MIEMDSIIVNEDLEANMLLQIHDELIFEIAEDKAEQIADRFANVMSHVMELKVPLECSISIGDSWGELK